MIRALTLIFASITVGAAIGFGLTYLAMVASPDTISVSP